MSERKPPRFPIVGALLCVACVGAAGWTWLGRHTRLVDQLVSANPPPLGELYDELLPTHSWAEDDRVWSAYRRIVSRGRSIVPTLIENLHRDEYSAHVPTAVEYDPQTVRDMCRRAVTEMYDPIYIFYKSRENSTGEMLLGRGHFEVVFETKDKARRWWESKKRMSADEIQKAVKDWYVERETSFGFEDDAQRKWALDRIERDYQRRSKVASYAFDPASIAGLVVGAMGVFVFTVALRHWLKERTSASLA